MKRQWNLLVPILLVAVVLIYVGRSDAQKLFEGYWEQTSITNSEMGPMGKQTQTKAEKVFFKPGKMKIVDLKSGDLTILRLDKELTWNVNKAKGTYTEMTFAQMQAAMEESKKAVKEMQEQMKDLTPEERQMMEKMMSGKKGATMPGEEKKLIISSKRTGETQTIGGYKCEHFVMQLNNSPLMDMWVTDQFNLGDSFMEFYKKQGIIQAEVTGDLKSFRGFSMKNHFFHDLGMGKVEGTTTVSKVVATSVPNSEFDLPPGLKKIQAPIGMKGVEEEE